ncbi:MAG: DUF3899 domain-containing protein [Oscillospiraceae bacterium]|nr:DUF3899 domain-containing protein [Oscillospiraceae bacterium]
MSENRKSFLADLILGALIFLGVFLLNRGQGFTLTRQLCDGAFVAAVILLGSGGIRFCSARGGLDMLGYGFKSVVEMFTKAGRMDGPDEDYFDYVQRKSEERKPFGHYLIAGSIFLALSLVFLVLDLMLA